MVGLIHMSYSFVILELNGLSPHSTFIILKSSQDILQKLDLSVSKSIQNYWVNCPFKSKHVHYFQ